MNVKQLREDHALLLKGICEGTATYRKWDDERGEVCIRGLAYAVHLDKFGCPLLHDHIRLALLNLPISNANP